MSSVLQSGLPGSTGPTTALPVTRWARHRRRIRQTRPDIRLVAGTSELARAALGALHRLTAWLRPRPLADDTLEACFEHVHAEGRSSASASLILAALRAAARAQGHRLHLPRSDAALAASAAPPRLADAVRPTVSCGTKPMP